jgi:hypothetical protein
MTQAGSLARPLPSLLSKVVDRLHPHPVFRVELVDITRRFRVGAALTIPLLVLAMGPFLGFEAS